MTSKLICLTPVLNEAWILDRFIRCASLWADHIIIADQGSTDGSREIAQKYDKVIFVDNTTNEDFNEYKMRAPLFEEAEKIPGPKILISVDADEILTPNFNSPEWNSIRQAKPGTIIGLPINNLLPNGKYWEFGEIWCGFVDDGTPYGSGSIHVPRTIMPPDNDILICNDIQLLHYKFLDWRRMQERNRWYQCFEVINGINDPLSIFRRYHHLESIPDEKIIDIPSWWQSEYAKLGIEITSILHKKELRWRKQVLSYMDTYGVKHFKHINIWDVNWCEIAKELQYNDYGKFKDPRKKWEKAVNRYLIATSKKQNKSSVHIMEKIIRKIYR